MQLAYTVFDFLPERPRAPDTALTLLTGGKVPGVTRERQLRRLPQRRCALVGEALPAQVRNPHSHTAQPESLIT